MMLLSISPSLLFDYIQLQDPIQNHWICPIFLVLATAAIAAPITTMRILRTWPIPAQRISKTTQKQLEALLWQDS
jgi:hypothetical protein